LQGPHGFDRVDRLIAQPARNRLVIEALHVLQGEFGSQMSARIFSITR
jgi:hypothetical protein